jgi:excisionase family DNA binding protein
MAQLLLAAEVAELLKVTEVRVYALARENRIPVVHIGRQVRFSRDAIEDWIACGGQGLSLDGDGRAA